jgi:hypothetical protein
MSREAYEVITRGLRGDAVGFLSRHVVMMGVRGNDGTANSQVRGFEFEMAYPTRGGGAVFKPTREELGGAEAPVFFYYLPWGTGTYMRLDPQDGPDFMITATVKGCAVGYERAADGAVRVGHYDLCVGGRGAKPEAARAGRGGVYADEDGVALIYGVRANRRWAIFAQQVTAVQTIDQPNGQARLDAEIRAVKPF